MKAVAIIEKGKDGKYGIYLENDNLSFGVIGDGKTVTEAIDDFNNSVDEMRVYYSETGKIFPDNLEFEFKYDKAYFKLCRPQERFFHTKFQAPNQLHFSTQPYHTTHARY